MSIWQREEMEKVGVSVAAISARTDVAIAAAAHTAQSRADKRDLRQQLRQTFALLCGCIKAEGERWWSGRCFLENKRSGGE